MISAIEAYGMTNEIVQKQLARWKKKINKKIMHSIKRADYYVHIYFQHLPDGEYRRLLMNYYKDLGYEVKLSLVRCDVCSKEYQLQISWENNNEVTNE